MVYDKGAGCEILHLYYITKEGELMFLRFLHKCGKIIVISKNFQMYWRRNNYAKRLDIYR